MRILFLCNSRHWGGAERYVVTLAGALARRGHSCWIAAPQRSALAEAAARTSGIASLDFELGPKLSRRSALDMAARWRIYRARLHRFIEHCAARLEIDVLHLQFKKEQILGTERAAAAGIPVVWTEHGLLPGAIARLSPARTLYRRAAARATRVVCVCSAVRDDICAAGVPAGQLVICHNGIEILPDVGPSERARLRAALGIAPHELIVGTAARLNRVKGIHVLLDAAPAILATVPAARILIAGDGPERRALEAQSQRNGSASRVLFTGHRPDARELLHTLDVFVAPSLAEGVPFAVLEAMAATRPVVGTRVGGVPEALAEGQAGVLVAPGNAVELATAVTALLREPARRRQLGEAAASRVRSTFMLARMIDGTEAVLEAAARNGTAARGAAPAALSAAS